MKEITTIVIIALCFLCFVLPVIAASEEQGIHAGIAVGAADNKGQSHGNQSNSDKGNENGHGDNKTSTTRVPEITSKGNGNNPEDTPRTISQIPGLNNQSGEDHGATPQVAGTVPPGWERNPNEIRDTVHSLLALENRTGGIGPQVSAIAREFNNSANTSQQYKNRIRDRDTLSRFFFGGDRQAAAELANITAQNQARISEIKNLMNTTSLDAETRSMMVEQLDLLQQNVDFDQQLSAHEKQDRGIFGWFS